MTSAAKPRNPATVAVSYEASSIDRTSAADLMQFATGDGRAAGHIGAVLVLDAAPGFSVEQARRVLVAELGTEPGTELSQLHRQFLTLGGAAPAGGWPGPVVPRELPGAVPQFTGRAAELAGVIEDVIGHV